MGIRILTAAASIALVTLTEAKARLGISGSAQDVRLQELIDGLSSLAMRLLKGTVYQQYEVTESGTGRSRLILPLRRIDPETLTAVDTYLDTESELDDIRITDPAFGTLFRRMGWPIGGVAVPDEDGEERFKVTFWAGWVPPGKLVAWEADTDVEVGDWIAPTDPTATPLLFLVITAGTTGSTEPAWPTAPGAFDEMDVDYRGAQVGRVPADVLRGFWVALETAWAAGGSPALAGVKRSRMGPHETEFFAPSDFDLETLPKPTLSLWAEYMA